MDKPRRDEKLLEIMGEWMEFFEMPAEKRNRLVDIFGADLLMLDGGVPIDGKVFFKDRCYLVTKDQLYED